MHNLIEISNGKQTTVPKGVRSRSVRKEGKAIHQVSRHERQRRMQQQHIHTENLKMAERILYK